MFANIQFMTNRHKTVLLVAL